MDIFYKKVNDSRICWINQGQPQGFGHAVLLSEYLSSQNDFLVHAGDVCILPSHKMTIIDRMRNFHYDHDMDITLIAKEITNIQSLKEHGIVVPGPKNGEGFAVKPVIEKPSNPPSNFAIMPLYIFKRKMFEVLKRTSVDDHKEIQLTNAIQAVIDNGGKVCALMMSTNDIRIDVGTPENYMDPVMLSYSSQINPAWKGK